MLVFTPELRAKLYAAATAIVGVLVALNVIPTGLDATILDIVNGVGGVFVGITTLMAKLNVSWGHRDEYKR